jgi:carboxyl-terminal processing protease
MTKVMMKGLLAVACAVLALTAAARAEEEHKAQPFLVVVGVNNYQDKDILPRAHAEEDAKALFDLYTNRDYYGVDADHARLLVGAEATRANILKAVQWFAKEAGPHDPVIFAFFGEGGPLGDLGDRHCYFASDSTLKGREKNAVAAAEISEALKEFKGQQLAVFLDVNFKGFNAPTDKPLPEPSFTEKPFAEWRGELGSEEGNDRTPGRVVFLANRPNSPSLDGPDHGIFAMGLLEALKGAADNTGKEADGLVTVDEVAEYLEKQIPDLARKYGKTEKDKEQVAIVLSSPNTHFVLSHNPDPYKKSQELLAKFEALVKDGKVPPKVAEEGRQLLARTPRLESQRELRKDYEKLAQGDLTADDFTKDRNKILEGTKLASAVADKFASKVIDATEVILSDYYKEENQGELVAQAIRKEYRFLEERIPDALEARLKKAKDLNEDQLKELLVDARTALGKREDLDKDKDIDVALVEMLRTLDPYTTYIDPETLNRFKIEIAGNFTGIGIQIRKDAATDLLLVVTPIKGSPAYRAGLLAGDLITTITREVDSDGTALPKPEVTPTKGLSVSDAVKKILGQKDTKVKLTVQREGVDKPIEVEITRGHVEVETVFGVKRKTDDSWSFMLDPEKKIGYLRLSQFQENSYNDILAAMADLKKHGVKGFILDLRFNPGGLLSGAVDISDLYMDDGVIVSIRQRGKAEDFIRGKHEGSLLNFPMVCLVNGDSASASEIVSACLQDHHRAYIVGERSFGKGSVQNIRDFGKGKLKLTTATFWRPSGQNLYKRSTGGRDDEVWGVIPDKTVKLSEKERGELFDHLRNAEVIPRRDAPVKEKEAKPEFKDVQLEEAIEYLDGQIKTASNNPVKKAG